MGGERASTTRQRQAGKICFECKLGLPPPDPPWTRGLRYCDACQPRPRRVMLNFDHHVGRYSVHFIEADCKTSVGPETGWIMVPNEDALRTFVQRCHPEDMEKFEQSLRSWGRGSNYVNLTEAQYRKLL